MLPLRGNRSRHRADRWRLRQAAPPGRAPLVLLLAALVAVSASGCGRGSREDQLTFGKEVYAKECSRCHMVDGSGVEGVYPNLDANPIVRLDSPEPTIDVVLRGREGMPAFGGQIPAQEIAAAISYIRRSWSNHASGVSPAQVK